MALTHTVTNLGRLCGARARFHTPTQSTQAVLVWRVGRVPYNPEHETLNGPDEQMVDGSGKHELFETWIVNHAIFVIASHTRSCCAQEKLLQPHTIAVILQSPHTSAINDWDCSGRELAGWPPKTQKFNGENIQWLFWFRIHTTNVQTFCLCSHDKSVLPFHYVDGS